jgi:hypothetical protein
MSMDITVLTLTPACGHVIHIGILIHGYMRAEKQLLKFNNCFSLFDRSGLDLKIKFLSNILSVLVWPILEI